MSAVPASSAVLRRSTPWRDALPAFLLLVAAIVLLYRDTALTMVGIWWRSETFAHAFLVLPITLWLVWRRRAELAALTPRAQPWILLPLMLAACFWLLSSVMVADVVGQFAFVTMLGLSVPAVLGTEVAMVILFPLLFLFFGVPFGEFVVPTMMSMTADFVVSALQMTGVPVFREGQHFIIPTGSWSVIDECSGVRYLMASFMVGTLFAYLNYRSYLRRAVFMVVALLVPVVANWLRAYMIVMLAYLSGNRIATGIDHILYGWVFFGIIIFLMFMIGARWAEPDEAPPVARGADDRSGPAAVAPAPARVIRAMWVTALAGAVVVLFPHAVGAGLQRAESAETAARMALPARLAAGWTAQGATLTAWSPVFTNPSAEVHQAYAGPSGTVGVHLAYYRGQGEDRKLVSSTNRLVPMRSDDWNLLPGARREVASGSKRVTVNTADILGLAPVTAIRAPHLVVWQVYWVDGRFIAGDAAAKIAGGLARLRGRGDEGASVVLYADAATVAASNAVLEAFVRDNLGLLGSVLQRTHDAR